MSPVLRNQMRRRVSSRWWWKQAKQANNMKQYVVGFYFCGGSVVLIRKNKPEKQVGKLNGVGGAVEANEMPAGAMVREFEEEASLRTSELDWKFFAVLRTNGAEICFFVAHGAALGISSGTDEAIYIVPVHEIPTHPIVLPNLKWLIPLALNNEPSVIVTQ